MTQKLQNGIDSLLFNDSDMLVG